MVGSLLLLLCLYVVLPLHCHMAVQGAAPEVVSFLCCSILDGFHQAFGIVSKSIFRLTVTVTGPMLPLEAPPRIAGCCRENMRATVQPFGIVLIR